MSVSCWVCRFVLLCLVESVCCMLYTQNMASEPWTELGSWWSQWVYATSPLVKSGVQDLWWNKLVLGGLTHQLNLLTAPEAMLALLLLTSCPSLVLCVESLWRYVWLVSRDKKTLSHIVRFFVLFLRNAKRLHFLSVSSVLLRVEESL